MRRKPILLGAIAILILALSGGTWAIVEARKVVVPDLAGLPLTGVDGAAGGLDLVLARQGSAPDDALAGLTTITGQDPQPGTRVWLGSTVTYTFELVDVEVPDVRGVSLRRAMEQLTEAGLTGRAVAATVPIVAEGSGGSGILAGTDPTAITRAVADLGLAGPVDVTGAPFALRGDPSEDWSVVDVVPAPDSAVEAGSIVNLTLVLPLGQMPDVVGTPYPDAANALGLAGAYAHVDATPHFDGVVPEGFPFDVNELAYSWWGGAEKDALKQKTGEPEQWVVYSQPVPAGQVFVRGQTVALVVQWPEATVPDITGLDLEAARKALNDAGLAAHEIYGSGTVRSQTYPPGTVLPMGASVDAELSHEVTFRVTSSGARGTVTWAAPGSFSIQQAVGTRLPWSQTWHPAAEPGRYDRGNLSAQMTAESGSITCEIIVDGDVVESNTSTGAYAVVSCG
ncbi:MAG: PASTA domain-containing protein [Actinomycetales bacterium]|nr:PASTA domain-containing protein [Actinomycetales bacterium]